MNRFRFFYALVLVCFLLFSQDGFCQVNNVIDKDISLIIARAPARLASSNTKTRKYWFKGRAYREVMALDTLAIPFLIDKITDTTQTNFRTPCVGRLLKTGDVAFLLLNHIVLIPWYAAFKREGDTFGCDGLPDGGWDDINNDRTKRQKQLRDFFASPKGKIWLRIFTSKLSNEERGKLLKEL